MYIPKHFERFIGISVTMFLLCGCLAACGGGDQAGTDTSDPAETAETAEAAETEQVVDSETAMDNFVKKLSAGNYVIDAAEFLKTTVYSPDQVYFSYYDEAYEDYGFMTLQGETFRASLDEDSINTVTFISNENAMDVAKKALPNLWMSESDGNMFNFFYNDPEAPLRFSSHDETVKRTLLGLAGYGEMTLGKMKDVYMELDAADPSSVHFTAEIEDDPVARIYYDDLDLTLQFGSAQSEPRMDAWLASPVYPETRTAWTEDDLFFLNSVFLSGYGEKAVPFPDFVSYAFRIDPEIFEQESYIYAFDAHGTEKDLESYISTLLERGFEKAEVSLEDGSAATVYRLLLREEYNSYVSLYPHFDQGFVLEAKRYYDNPVYDNLADINTAIGDFGFPALPEDARISGWTAMDTWAERTESWLYFFEYELALYAKPEYENREDLEAYLEEYGDLLASAGYHPVYSGSGEAAELNYYASANESQIFKYENDQDGLIRLQFRCEKNIPVEEAEKIIMDAGFPEISLHGDVFCRDISRYYKMVSGFEGLDFTVSQPFDSAEDAEAFLDAYTAALEEAGYFYENPQVIGSLKQIAYYDEENDRYFAFDYFPEEEPPCVRMDFVVR